MGASLSLYGLSAARILGLSIATCVVLEYGISRIIASRDTVWNWNSVVYSVLLAFFMPYNTPWWLIVVGCAILILVGEKLFGGLGAFPVHPVVLTYAILLVSWPHRFDYTASLISLQWDANMIEPLRLVKTLGNSAETAFDWRLLFLGKQSAGIGNSFILYLLIGGILLLLLRQIRWHIPVAFFLGVISTSFILQAFAPSNIASPGFQVLTGSVVFAAFFIATDFTTSPVHPVPMLVYGFLGGILVVLIRSFSNHIDGIAFAILLINLTTPLLDRIAPKVLGAEVPANA